MSGSVLFADDASQDAMRDAKEYIARYGLTRDDVKLVVRGRQTLIIAKRDIRNKIFTRPENKPIQGDLL